MVSVMVLTEAIGLIRYLKIEFEKIEELREYIAHTRKDEARAIKRNLNPLVQRGRRQNKAWSPQDEALISLAYAPENLTPKGRLKRKVMNRLMRKLKRSAGAISGHHSMGKND
jgi:hypothetical protein